MKIINEREVKKKNKARKEQGETEAIVEGADGLVAKALDSQSRGPVFKNQWVAPRSTQPFILPRSIN